MKDVANILKFLAVAILAAFYWPFNSFFMYVQKHYKKWQKEDPVSYVICIPLYFVLLAITAALSWPLEKFGMELHPPLSGFK